MPNHRSFRLNRSGVLLALISTAFAGEAGAIAGRVEFAIGGATVSGASGQQRPLAKGIDLDKGDTVRTTEDGRVQIRFTDGAYVSLQPNTEFAIKDYNFEGKTDGSERGLFSLAKGAMRTVTGLIGRINRNRYQVTTPTATIGIRGTGGRIEVLLDGSTLIAGTSGIWTLSNPSGTLDIPAGTFGKAPAAPNQPPQQTSRGPSTGPAPLPGDTPKPPDPKGVDKQIDTACQTNPSAASCVKSITGQTVAPPPPPNPNPPLVTGAGYHVSYAYVDPTGLAGLNDSVTLANVTFDAAGKMTQFAAATNNATFTGTHQEFGTAGGVVAWGRWTGPRTFVDGGNSGIRIPLPSQGYHYVVGMPATGMPTAGGAAFTLVGATKPTGGDLAGTLTPGTFSGTLTVNNWATGSMTVAATLSFTPTTGAFNYSFSGPATFTPGSPKFSSGLLAVPITIAAPVGYQCTLGCNAQINGAFFGAGALFAGYAYQISGTANNIVAGTAVFKQ